MKIIHITPMPQFFDPLGKTLFTLTLFTPKETEVKLKNNNLSDPTSL